MEEEEEGGGVTPYILATFLVITVLDVNYTSITKPTNISA